MDPVRLPPLSDKEVGEAQIDQMALIDSDRIGASNHISSCLPILTY